MELKLKRPIAFFDLEATGINIMHDRIVEIAVVKIKPDQSEARLVYKINPRIPIPVESSLIHGIYDEDVTDCPTFPDIAKELYGFLEGCDLSGFNCVKFDIPMLVEEFLRAGMEFDISKRKVVDAQKIFHLMEPRTLEAAYRFYCGKSLENAHSAEADSYATLEVLQKQIEKYQGQQIKDQKGNLYEPVKNDMDELHKLSMSNNADLAGRLKYNSNGAVVFNFGKHKDKPVSEVLSKEPSYYDWMMNGDFPLDTKKKLTQIKLQASAYFSEKS